MAFCKSDATSPSKPDSAAIDCSDLFCCIAAPQRLRDPFFVRPGHWNSAKLKLVLHPTQLCPRDRLDQVLQKAVRAN
jgi:hypothetical protein